MSFDLEQEIEKFEKLNNVSEFEKDTSLAIMMIQKNEEFIKSKIHSDHMYVKHRNATRLILRSYPTADKRVVAKELLKIHIYPNKLIFLAIVLMMISIAIAIITILYNLITEDMFGLFLLASGVVLFVFFITAGLTDKLRDNLND